LKLRPKGRRLANPNHAWISYLGYKANTPGSSGHVFSVTYDPTAGSVSVQSLDYDIGDQPVDAVVENTNDDLYVGTDFGVDVLPSGGTALSTAANGLPVVTVSSLTVNPSAHQLLAATHGRGVYQLTLP
jgi:ligand-binding sensor domain-containing protein